MRATPPSVFRTFTAQPVEGGPGSFWMDEALEAAGGVQLTRDPYSKAETNLIARFPQDRKLDGEDPRAYVNIRLDSGRSGVWITPCLVKGLHTTPRVPGHVFLRLSERAGPWIKVKGELVDVARALGIRIQKKRRPGGRRVPPLCSRTSGSVQADPGVQAGLVLGLVAFDDADTARGVADFVAAVHRVAEGLVHPGQHVADRAIAHGHVNVLGTLRDDQSRFFNGFHASEGSRECTVAQAFDWVAVPEDERKDMQPPDGERDASRVKNA